MMKVLKKYYLFLISIILISILFTFNTNIGLKAIMISGNTLGQLILILPAIFLVLGLLDVWVPRETMIKFMGEGSGIKGIALAFLLGSATAGPLYGAFPVAAVLMKKGVKFSNILIFIGAWSTTKIPMILFEIESLGLKFGITRLLIDIPGIIIMSFLICKYFLSKNEILLIEQKYKNES
ncbi:MAG: permease [Caldisericia bacterium]|nr:permease [Caldisericia bacterium]